MLMQCLDREQEKYGYKYLNLWTNRWAENEQVAENQYYI